MAVRTPASSGLDDWGEVRKLPVTQLRKVSRALGMQQRLVFDPRPRSNSDSTRLHVAAICGFTTSSISSCTISSCVRSASGFWASSARSRPAEMFAVSMAI